MKQQVIDILELKKAKLNGSSTIDDLIDEISLLEDDSETLEDIIEDLGKRMCYFKFLYPNAGYWTIQDMWGWEYKGETLIECFKEFRKEVRRKLTHLIYPLTNNNYDY